MEIPEPGDKARLYEDKRSPSPTIPSFLLVPGAQAILLALGTGKGTLLMGSVPFRLGCRQVEGEPLLKKERVMLLTGGFSNPYESAFWVLQE